MMKPISTRTHGMLDFLSAGALMAAPRLLGFSGPVTNLMTGAGAGALAYSVLTKYEFGLMPVLPMPAHLTLDAASGVMLCAAPFVMNVRDTTTRQVLVGMGLMEISAAFLTQTQPERVGLPL